MSAKIYAEELLLLMTYAFDLLAMPTFRKWDRSYEGWLFSNGLLQRLHYLQKQKLLEGERTRMERVFRVTKAGRQYALGGRDPEEYWRREWNGKWWQIVFDLPTSEHKTRSTLIRWLRQNGFGYLQDSVWIGVRPVSDLAQAVKRAREDAAMFTVLECRCAAGFSNEALVRGAWQFDAIREEYRKYQEFARSTAKRLRKERLHPAELFALLRNERERWLAAFDLDPLLPEELWPKGYIGREAWQARGELLREAAKQAMGENVQKAS